MFVGRQLPEKFIAVSNRIGVEVITEFCFLAVNLICINVFYQELRIKVVPLYPFVSRIANLFFRRYSKGPLAVFQVRRNRLAILTDPNVISFRGDIIPIRAEDNKIRFITVDEFVFIN